jgi:hypothetical protein
MPNLLLLARAYGVTRTGECRHLRCYVHCPSYEPGKAILVDLRDAVRMMPRIDVLSIAVVHPAGWGLRNAAGESSDVAVQHYPGHLGLTRQSQSLSLLAEPLQGWRES